MIETVNGDLFRWYGKNEFSTFEILKAFNIPQVRFMIAKRYVDHYRNINKLFFLINIIRYTNLKIKFGIDMPASVKLGKGIMVEHFGGISINPLAQFGNNVNLYNGVTIGVEKRGKRKGVPIIGNQVWLGPNSIIVGNITIGNNVLIAPGAFVNFDVPDNSIVLGNPGKIIANNKATSDYITNMI